MCPEPLSKAQLSRVLRMSCLHHKTRGKVSVAAEGAWTVLLHRRLPDGVEADIIATIKKTFNFSQSDAIHLFQTLMECMKSKELVRLCLRAAESLA